MTQDLKPLPKLHYTWPSCAIADDDKWNKFTELARTVSVHVDHFRPETFATARALAERHKAKVGVLIDAWGYGQGFDPAADPTGMANTIAGAAYMVERLKVTADAMAGLPVEVVQIVYERHHVKPPPADPWNNAIDERARIVFELCREAFPGVRVEFYNYGHRHPSSTAGGNGWQRNGYLPDWLTFGDFDRSCSLYEPAEIGLCRDIFRKVCDDFPGMPVTPHLALGWSHCRKANAGNYAWVPDWEAEDGHNYPLVNSWCLGAEMNEPWYSAPERRHLFPEWSRATSVWLWPAMGERAASWDHWRAYVQGANGVEITGKP